MARSSLKNVMRLLEDANGTVSPEQNFLADLERSIEMDDAKNQRLPSRTYKPSSMQCIRNMYYQVTGAPQDQSSTSYTLIGITSSGGAIHARIQKSVAGMRDNLMDCEWVDVAQFIQDRGLDYLEVRSQSGMETKLFHKSLNMSFMCDGIIKYRGKYYILELKTETTNKFFSRKAVDPKHYNQATAYSLAFDIPDVLFVYINRDILDMKSFLFHVTDDMKMALVGKIEECDRHVALECPPVKPSDASPRFCQYCGYKEICSTEIE